MSPAGFKLVLVLIGLATVVGVTLTIWLVVRFFQAHNADNISDEIFYGIWLIVLAIWANSTEHDWRRRGDE